MKRNFIYSFIGLLVTSILFLGFMAPASAQTVSETQAAIKAKGANWVAGDNPMSRLTLDQKRNTLGLLLPPASEAPPPASHPSTVGLPSSIDWRNNGGNYVSDIKSQGMCNSCWAFSTTAAVESAVMIANKTPNANLDLMEAVLISCCTNCSARACASGYLGPAAAYMVSHGEPLQTCPATDCNYTCPNDTIKSYESVAQDANSMKAAIANYGPIVAGMHVYDDFYNYTGGVYSYTGAGYVGDHAIALIGYNDAGQYFIGKNSWGTGWGEAGFFRIAYSEVNGTSSLGMQSIAYHGGDPTPPPPTCTSYPIGDYFAGSGGTGNIQVATEAGCAWTASSNATWISFPSGSNGSGPGPLTYSVAPNTTSSRRTGTMTVPGGTYTVLQESGSNQCTYSLSPTSKSFPNSGGSGSISVTAGSGCPWTATSSVSWISVSGSGSGSGTVNYSVQANAGTSLRTGTMTIGGQTFTVSQAGITCTYAISPATSSPSAAGGTGSVGVTAATGCAWTAASNASWITINSGNGGSGNGTVTYTVAANSAASSRTGTMTIGGQTHTASQAGITCTYAISPASQNFTTTASGTGTVNVTAASGCAWTAASNATSWLTVTSGASGTGSGTVSYSVAANTGTSRSGTLTIAGQTFTATQAGTSPTCSVSLGIGGFNAGYAGRQYSFQVSAASTCSWNASASAPWITFNSGATGKGNGTVIFTTNTNTGSARTGTISINGSSLFVNQAGSTTCTYTISPTSQNFTTATSGTGTVNVIAGSGCAWTATSSAGWITINSGSSGSGNGTVGYSVAANTGSSRTGTMIIAGQTFTVTQAGAATCSYTLSSTSQNFSTTGGSGTVNVTAAAGCSWTAASNVNWLTVTPGIGGSGNGSVSYSVAANAGIARTGTLTIANQTFTVSQDGTSPTCSVYLSAGGFNFGYLSRQGSFLVQAATGCSWSASTNVPWITFNSGATGKGNGTVVFTIDTNTSAARTGTISVNGVNVTVNEQAHP